MSNYSTYVNPIEFETWLARQSNDRRFVYTEGWPTDPTGCLLCNFFRDVGRPEAIGSWTSVSQPVGSFIEMVAYELPENHSAGEVKALYQKFLNDLSKFPK